MATSRAQGITRKAVSLANGASTVHMCSADQRDLTLVASANVTWQMSFDSLDAINAGTAAWVNCPAAADGVIKMEGITAQAVKATASAATTAVACWKA